MSISSNRLARPDSSRWKLSAASALGNVGAGVGAGGGDDVDLGVESADDREQLEA